ncbi:hypothetical protein HMPREF3223_01779 [Cutibacterium avidum]|nr:hypothetical protein HMPREF3223_01779 [Cutibacterium avidum]
MDVMCISCALKSAWGRHDLSCPAHVRSTPDQQQHRHIEHIIMVELMTDRPAR